MSLLSSPLLEAIGNGRAVFAVEFDIGGTTYRYAQTPIESDSLGFYEDRVVGFGSLGQDLPLNIGGLNYPTTSVSLQDNDETITQLFKGQYALSIEGSVARQKIIAQDIDADQYHTVFTGVIASKKLTKPYEWAVNLRMDNAKLRGLINLPLLTSYDFANLGDGIEGTYATAVYGEHDDSGTTGGLITCPLIDTVNDKYLVSVGWIADVTKIYSNDASLVGAPTFSATGANDWTYETVNGRRYTILTLSGEGLGGTEVITCNCKGLTDAGDGSQGGGSGTLIENAAKQLEHCFANFVFNAWETGDFYTPSDASVPISADWFSLAAAYFDIRGAKGSRVIDGGQTGEAVLNDWCASEQMPAFWSRAGELALASDDHYLTTTDITWPWLTHTEGQGHIRSISYHDDTSALLDEVKIKYMHSHKDSAYYRSVRVKDTRRGWGVSKELQQPWTRSSLT